MSLKTGSADPHQIRTNKLDLVERVADDLAHEIKNPLHSMVINLEVLKRRIARPEGSEPDELLRYVGVLASELERVNQRVELLLRMVRPERGGEPTTLPETVEELIHLLDLEWERRQVTLLFEPAPVPIRAHLARDPARQLILNLILEALDAAGTGGRLLVRTEVEAECTRLRIEVAPGPAMNGTADFGSDTPRLAVARLLTGRLGGRLDASSPPDSGADAPHIVLTFPLAPAGAR